jgi:hypothetical protein
MPYAQPPQAPCTPPGLPAPSPPCPPSTYVQAYQPSGQVWVLSVADGKLHLETAEGTHSTCEKLTILVNGVEPVAVTVSDNLIRLSAGSEACKSSCHLQATARKVSRTGPNGATLVLEGDATLSYSQNGKKIAVSTDLLSVNMVSGQVISEMQVKPVTPVTPCYGTSSVPAKCPPACTPAAPSFGISY